MAHNPRIILIAPPPINEHLWWPRDQESGYASVSRTAATTKEYADAVVELGAKLNLPVVNLWKAFMAKTDFQIEGWKVGDLLPGSLDSAQNDALVELMYDGKYAQPQIGDPIDTGYLIRPSLPPRRLSNSVSGGNKAHCRTVAGSGSRKAAHCTARVERRRGLEDMGSSEAISIDEVSQVKGYRALLKHESVLVSTC